MSKIKIGILKENKIPIDKRVPLTPEQCNEALKLFPDLEIKVQSSDIRCFSDEDYEEQGVEVVTNLEDCDILMGVKEVPIDLLIDNKTYFFFSHTIKEQPYNKNLLKSILSKGIRLIDYEVLKDNENTRIIAFGRYAGIVGAYNGIWTYGKRYNLFNLRRAHECFDLEDLKSEYSKVRLPAIKIAITGGGRVAKGAIEVLLGMKIKKVTPAEYLDGDFDVAVFTQLSSRDYHYHKEGLPFKRHDFFEHPEHYKCNFFDYAKETDLLIAGAYWDPSSPVLFTVEQSTRLDFRIRIIADITCDIEGSIPSTKRASTIDNPIYDYNPSDDSIEKALSDEGNITVMAVDNLPCELPRDASYDFGKEFIKNVLPQLWNGDKDHILEKATIAQHGQLTKHFEYLKKYADLK